jgi:hydroxyacylglutathione hydrolase
MNIPTDKPNLTVHQIKTGCLAQFAYIVHSGTSVAIVDPIRDIDYYVNYIKENVPVVEKSHIYVTHYHADFVAGHRELANVLNCDIVFGPTASPNFHCHVAEDLERIPLGDYNIQVLHTPGHTLESSCFVLSDSQDSHFMVFTGDTLFLGDVGRPDLAQKGELTMEGLAKMLFNSCKRLKALPDDCLILPGHGAGSACGKSISNGTSCIIGNQKKSNYAFKLEDEHEFVAAVVTGLDVPPPYFGHNVAMNKSDNIPTMSELVETKFKELSLEQFVQNLETPGTYVLDCRPQAEFDIGHIKGSLWVPLD